MEARRSVQPGYTSPCQRLPRKAANAGTGKPCYRLRNQYASTLALLKLRDS